jgi:hypothetical protein
VGEAPPVRVVLGIFWSMAPFLGRFSAPPGDPVAQMAPEMPKSTSSCSPAPPTSPRAQKRKWRSKQPRQGACKGYFGSWRRFWGVSAKNDHRLNILPAGPFYGTPAAFFVCGDFFGWCKGGTWIGGGALGDTKQLDRIERESKQCGAVLPWACIYIYIYIRLIIYGTISRLPARVLVMG